MTWEQAGTFTRRQAQLVLLPQETKESHEKLMTLLKRHRMKPWDRETFDKARGYNAGR